MAVLTNARFRNLAAGRDTVTVMTTPPPLPIVPRRFRSDPEGLAAHAQEEHRALYRMAFERGVFPTDPFCSPVREALHSLMARGYLLPSPPSLPGAPWGYRLDARGERVKRGEEARPTPEVLAATYLDEAVKPQHQLLCGHLGRGVHGPAEARAVVDFNGARWEAVVDFARVVDVSPPGTLESLPLYAVELTRNGDRLSRCATVFGGPVGFGLWAGGRPSVGLIVSLASRLAEDVGPAGSLPSADWPVLALLSAKLREAGAAVEAAYPNAGWTGGATRDHAQLFVLGRRGGAKEGDVVVRAVHEIPAALRLGLRGQWSINDAGLTTQAEVEALAEKEAFERACAAGLPYMPPSARFYIFVDGVEFHEDSPPLAPNLFPDHLEQLRHALAAMVENGSLVVPSGMLTPGAPDHGARVMREMGVAAQGGGVAFRDLAFALDTAEVGTPEQIAALVERYEPERGRPFNLYVAGEPVAGPPRERPAQGESAFQYLKKALDGDPAVREQIAAHGDPLPDGPLALYAGKESPRHDDAEFLPFKASFGRIPFPNGEGDGGSIALRGGQPGGDGRREGLVTYVAGETITEGDTLALPLGAAGPAPHPVYRWRRTAEGPTQWSTSVVACRARIAAAEAAGVLYPSITCPAHGVGPEVACPDSIAPTRELMTGMTPHAMDLALRDNLAEEPAPVQDAGREDCAGPTIVHTLGADGERATYNLRVHLWSKQRLVLRLLEHPNALVAVAAGHKVGTTMTAAVAVTWWALSQPKGRLVIVGDCEARAQHLIDLVGKLTVNATPPIDMESFDATVALVDDPDVAEFFTGIPNVPTLYVVDNAEDLHSHVYNMMMAARVGARSDTRILMLGRPLGAPRGGDDASGLWKAFHEDASLWQRVMISSEETPNVVAGARQIPGLATREWVEEKRIEWGPDYATDPRYCTRILGQFIAPRACLTRCQVASAERRDPLGIDCAVHGVPAKVSCP